MRPLCCWQFQPASQPRATQLSSWLLTITVTKWDQFDIKKKERASRATQRSLTAIFPCSSFSFLFLLSPNPLLWSSMKRTSNTKRSFFPLFFNFHCRSHDYCPQFQLVSHACFLVAVSVCVCVCAPFKTEKGLLKKKTYPCERRSSSSRGNGWIRSLKAIGLCKVVFVFCCCCSRFVGVCTCMHSCIPSLFLALSFLVSLVCSFYGNIVKWPRTCPNKRSNHERKRGKNYLLPRKSYCFCCCYRIRARLLWN